MSIANEKVLRLKAVMARTGLSRSSIYAFISKKEFPAPIKLGRRAVGWLDSDLDAWLVKRVSSSHKPV